MRLVRPPDQLESESRHSRPLPAALAARADALSAPYALALKASNPHGGTTLADRIGDLHRIPGRVPPKALASGADSSTPAAGAALEFVDDADAAGLRFVFDNGRTPLHLLPETVSGGLGLLDYNGDGWLDVYCVQGGTIEMPGTGDTDAEPIPGDRLFRNKGDGSFVDATEQSGIRKIAWGRGYGAGVAIGDFDNDGHPDLFVSRLASYALYRNKGDGTFEDVTERTDSPPAR